MAGPFSNMELAPEDLIFGLNSEMKADPSPEKVGLLIGAYRTELGEPYVFPVVRSVEESMAKDKTLNHEYLPIEGMPDLCKAATRLALGSDCQAVVENRVCAVQTLSGTGALRVCFEFLFRNLPMRTVAVSKPTWGNHKKILQHTGYTDVREYTYFDSKTLTLNLTGMLEDLRALPEGCIVVLHTCAHNPSGVDPTQEEWKQICEVVKERNLLPVFDSAYQGFVSGDTDLDGWSAQYFASQGVNLLITQSFAKIFGIYNERCGNLIVVCNTSQEQMHVFSQLKAIIRPMYSNPPNHGARIVASILNNPALCEEWNDQLKAVAERILRARQLLLSKLKELGTPGDWAHITNQCGMFTFTGLNAKQVQILKQKYHIYMLPSGRINMCGITPQNVDYVTKAFDHVVRNA